MTRIRSFLSPRATGAGARTLRRCFVVAVAIAIPALAASLVHAAGEPTIVSARTGDNGDGFVDVVTVQFSVPMNQNTLPKVSSGPGQPGFRVAGYTITSRAWTSATTLDLVLAQKTAPDTAATPEVVYETGGGDATSTLNIEAEGKTLSAADGAGPVLMSVHAYDIVAGGAGLYTANGEFALITFSEPTTLAGATKTDRWSNLEKAIKFENQVVEGGTCAVDGDGGVSNFNFPQPDALKPQGIDPIARSDDGATFKVTRNTDSIQGNYKKFPGTPTGCKVGIDPTIQNRSVLTDAANNVARGMDVPTAAPRKVRISPVDAKLMTARTVDGRGAAPDGSVDAIELTFDQAIDDDTIEDQLDRIAISLAGVTATTVEEVDTGATSDDSRFYVRFTLPADVVWDGAATPQVRYTKPGTCTPDAGDGLRALVPTPGFSACVASFNTVVADGAGPVLLDSTTLDQDGDGKVDAVRATFSEAVTVGKPNGWTLGGRAATAYTADTDQRKATIAFVEAAAPDTDERAALAYANQPLSTRTSDAAANEVLVTTGPVKKDGAAPRVVTAFQYDLNGDGAVERAVVEYSEPVEDVSGAAAANFSIGGTGATLAAPHDADDDPDAAEDRFVSLAVGGLTGTNAKEMAYTAGSAKIEDLVGNDATAQTITAASVVDKAKPRATITVSPGAPIKAGTATVTATFSEDMAVSSAPSATLGDETIAPSAAAGHTNGWVDADHRVWEGSVSIAAGDCAVATGCPVTITIAGAQDLEAPANTQVTATKATEIDTIAPQAPVPGSFTSTLAAGESAPAGVVNMFTRSITVDAAVVPAEAEDGAAKLLLGDTEITGGLDDTIGATDTTVAPTKTFADLGALRQLFTADGPATLKVQLCDDAGNCTTSAAGVDVTVDTEAVPVELGGPQGGIVVAGGSAVEISWNGDDAGPGFDHVDIAYSTNGGTSYPHDIATGLTERDGTHSWTAPSIEDGDVRVRVAAVDVNGNKAYDASDDVLAIDSKAPTVSITAPTSRNPFLPADGTTTIRWNAADATIDRADDPITIEYSTNGGSSWHEINGGSYSKADDGQERWNVPDGASFSTLIRVTATDAADKSTTKLSTKLAKGVEGWVTGYSGRIYGFGTASQDTRESLSLKSDWVRGMALRSNRRSGYLVSRTGRLYPFAIGGASMPSKPSRRSLGGDLARGLVLRSDSSGYILDAYGRIHAWGGAPKAYPSETWVGKNRARDIVLLKNERGGYVLDVYGRLHPFRVKGHSYPREIQSRKLWNRYTTRAVVLRANERSGWLMDYDGRLRAFGGAPSVKSTGTGPDARALIKVTEDGGYWVDYKGRLHAWGSAFGDPTEVVITRYYARAAAAA